jgi:hypothetical protein
MEHFLQPSTGVFFRATANQLVMSPAALSRYHDVSSPNSFVEEKEKFMYDSRSRSSCYIIENLRPLRSF